MCGTYRNGLHRGFSKLRHCKYLAALLEHFVEKPVLQNSINYDDTTLNCNLLDLINVSEELVVILDENKENPNVTNRGTPKINFHIHSTAEACCNFFTFTEEIPNEKLHFLSSAAQRISQPKIIQGSSIVRVTTSL